MLVTISFHRHPVVARSQYLFGHRVPTRMSAKRTFVYFMHQQIVFTLVHASEQHHVKVSFIQNVSIQEEITSQSSQRFLVFIRCPGWVLLALEETLDIMEPWFVIDNFFSGEHMSRSLKTPDADQRYFISTIYLVH